MSIEPVPRIGQGRCGCTGEECTCVFEDTATVLVSGDGSVADPIELDIINPRAHVEVGDTATVDLTKTGSGTPANPVHISGTSSPVAIAVTTILASGSYSVPATASMLAIKVVAPGGGGGGAQVAATSANGGGGGQGGGITEVLVPTSEIGPTLTIVIGAVGAQGNAASSGGGTGTNGGTGGNVTVADGPTLLATATGGEGGKAGGLTGVGGDLAQTATIQGGKGASSVDSGTTANAPNTCRAASGGGAGMSYSAANVVIPGSDGGDPLCLGTVGAAAGTVAGGLNGAALSHAGGGGGGISARGGNGGTYGGGGGGGGADITGVAAAGDGGLGGAGVVEISAW